MIGKEYFFLDESPVYKGKYLIRFNYENFLFPHGTSGSYDVFIARLLNLSYSQMLRYCRDRLGAELIGKNRRYIVVYFDNTKEVRMFLKLLNNRMKYIMDEHDNPYEYKQEADGEITRTPFNLNEDNSRLNGKV